MQTDISEFDLAYRRANEIFDPQVSDMFRLDV